jgi:hypothetical protein
MRKLRSKRGADFAEKWHILLERTKYDIRGNLAKIFPHTGIAERLLNIYIS